MSSSREPIRLLIVGRCPDFGAALEAQGVHYTSFTSIDELLGTARQARGRACVICPDMIGEIAASEGFISRLRGRAPFLDIVAWVPDADARAVREAMLHGVRDVILDDDPAVLARRILEIIDEQQYLPRLLEHEVDFDESWEFEGMLSRSRKMRDIFEVCVRSAGTDATVLILGETGTGKELLARAFHNRSDRGGRMVSINCSAVPENLIDSELFGHMEGAFTGANDDKDGLFRFADEGTLFLDEVGSIPLQVQYRLLRVLQEGRVRPVGSDSEVEVDVRVIAATSVHLNEAVEQGRFRRDLLYRLDVIRVLIPPLRERPEDILFLFGHFLKKLSEHHGLPRPEMDDSFLDAFQAYEWPGNIRQLENLTERLLLTKHGDERLTAKHFATLVAPQQESTESLERRTSNIPDLGRPLSEVTEETVDRVEEAYLRAALERTNGRALRTAEIAGISRRTLLRKLKKLGIDRRAYRSRHVDGLPEAE